MPHDDFNQTDPTDIACLRRFAADGSPDAFAVLVRRRIDLVYSAAIRQVNDRALAEDVTQQVFITLARRASSLIDRDIVLSAWLLRAARLTALDALRRERRRRKHEQRAALMNHQRTHSSSDDKTWADVRPLLDGALMLLGEKDRRAIALRYFEGRSISEVGTVLGVSEEAARQRLWRAIERLRARLSAHGATLAATSLASALSMNAVQAAPVALAEITARVAVAAAVSKATIPLGFKGVQILMATFKAKLIVTASAVLLLSGGAVVAYKAARPAPDQIVSIASLKSNGPPDPLNLSQSMDVTRSIPQRIDESTLKTEWERRFNTVYGLAPGEVIKHVPKPYIPERQSKWNDECRRMRVPDRTLDPRESITFGYDRNGIHWKTLWMDQTILGQAMRGAGIKSWEYDESVPYDLSFPGDWVLRIGLTPEQGMDALGEIVTKRLGKPVRFEKQVKLRDAIVVHGQYLFSPLAANVGGADRNVLEFADKKPNPLYPTTIESMKLSEVFEKVGISARLPVVDESDSGNIPVRVRYSGASSPEPVLLDRIGRQTGLRFDHAKREVGVWVMVDGGAK